MNEKLTDLVKQLTEYDWKLIADCLLGYEGNDPNWAKCSLTCSDIAIGFHHGDFNDERKCG